MRRVRRKSAIDYILPFLIIVGLGVISVLGFQLWSSFVKQGKADAYFYIAQGKAKVLQDGQTQWDNAFSGTKFLLGDSLKTSPVGKVVLQFFNGTIIRLGNDTAVTLKDLSKAPDQEKVGLNLDNGFVWVLGKKSEGVKEARYEVHTTHMNVKATGTVFEVESGTSEVVRVFDGNVTVDIKIKNNGTERIADTITVGVGQEITLDDATIKAFEANQSPSVLQAVSDDFKTTDWYRWNALEDDSPTNFSMAGTEEAQATESQVATPSGSQQTNVSSHEAFTQQTDQVMSGTEEVSGSLEAPVITKPDGGKIDIDADKYVISGTVNAGVAKVTVEQVVDGKVDKYTLSKFKKGDTSWSYNVSAALGNMKSGENVYSFYAFDADGNKSDSAEVTINYNKPEVKISDALTAPVVKTFNGSTISTVSVGKVKVEGDIKGAEKIVVNDYTLSQFSAGDNHWVYYANAEGGNLKPGVNEYKIYGIDPDGNKSDVVTFTITYNKEAGSTQAVSPTPSPAPSPVPGF